jgi:PRTRC genetic system protein E
MLKKLSELVNDSITVGLTIDIKDGEVTMLVKLSPKTNDSALTGLPPVVISGTPEECEEDFIKFFESPSVEQINDAASGVLEFEQAAKKAAEENKVAKERKDKIEKLLKKGEEHLNKEEYVSADKVKGDIEKILGKTKNKKFTKFCADLTESKAADGQVDIFSDEAKVNNPIKSNRLDPDVQVKGKDSRAVQYGISQEQIEIIEQEQFDKLDQDGNTDTSEEF